MNTYVIYKFGDYDTVKKIVNDIRKVVSDEGTVFMFEPDGAPRRWHDYARKKLRESQLVILFDSLSGETTSVGKHISWQLKMAEKLKKRIVIFKADPDSKNRSWYENAYSDQAPPRPRYQTKPLSEAVEFMRGECNWQLGDNLLRKKAEEEPLTDTEKQLLLEQYRIMIETSEKLMERRQETVNLYITLCTTILALIGASFAFNNLTVCGIILWLSGLILIILCHNWRLSLQAFDLNNTGKFEVINCMEKRLPAEMFECEYRYNKMNGIRSFSSRERVLPLIFSAFGIVLMLVASALLICLLFKRAGM